MNFNQAKFRSNTEKAVHNMRLLVITPCGLFFAWQSAMVLTDNPAGNLGGVLLWGMLAAGYWFLAGAVQKKYRLGRALAILFLAFVTVSFFVFVKFDGREPEAILVYIWPAVNLYILFLLAFDRKKYFAVAGK